MMSFSIEIGLKRVEIVRPEQELSLDRSAGSGCCAPLEKQVTKRIGGGSPVAAPMPKLVLSCRKNRLTALGGRIFCVPYTDRVTWYL